MSSAEPSVHRFACDAMATTFEILIRGEEHDYARQAAAAASEETRRIEHELSRFIGYSDVSQINRLKSGERVRVGVAVFDCLKLALAVHADTGGAFDVTLGTGLDQLHMDDDEHSVGVSAADVTLDLGGIGKGYAVDRMVEILREWSVEDALIHAGESTASAMGRWTVEVRDPKTEAEVMDRVTLCDRALSGSGTLLQGRHIIDPRTGRPAEGALGAWAAAPSAALSDALSTAFMVMSVEEVKRYCDRHADVAAMLVAAEGVSTPVRFGRWE